MTLNANAPAANAIDTSVFSAATASTFASNSNGRVTTMDANGDGILGDQFRLTFTELVQVAPLGVATTE